MAAQATRQHMTRYVQVFPCDNRKCDNTVDRKYAVCSECAGEMGVSPDAWADMTIEAIHKANYFDPS
jgi:hypothetical protein